VYNAGSGHGTSISEIVEAIRAVTQVRFDTVYKPGRPIDVPRSVLDCSRAKSDFGWESKTQFVPQLQTTWKWIKDHSLVAAGSSP
jgi:UDP-glucose 4-epimerase